MTQLATPPVDQLATVVDAFESEVAVFRALVADAPEEAWALTTPAAPWTVRDQVAHVAFVFDLAYSAVAEPSRFEAITSTIAPGGFDAAVNAALALYNHGTTAEVLARYDENAAKVATALRGADVTSTVPWLVNPLPPQVLTVAGMVELFAHGQDVADTLGVAVERTDRVAALIPFIHRTLPFGYLARGLEAPTSEFRFAVQLPSGATVEAGPAEAPNLVCGTAVDLALLATRRRHVADLQLHAVGPEAASYLEVAQAYRGPAGEGRQPLSPAPSA